MAAGCMHAQERARKKTDAATDTAAIPTRRREASLVKLAHVEDDGGERVHMELSMHAINLQQQQG
jgi:hypothetical protein